MAREVRIKTKPGFYVDCNVPARLKTVLETAGLTCVDARPKTPDLVVARAALLERMPLVTINIVDFLPIVATQEWHPGLIAFSSVREGYTSQHQIVTFRKFAEWVGERPGYNFANQLIVVPPEQPITVFQFSAKGIYQTEYSRRGDLNGLLRHWHYTVRRQLTTEQQRKIRRAKWPSVGQTSKVR
ncbi:MAG: hypothetical protein EYC62_05225 [Alphaproteobacteria bacterium]|nr:MAG: hypothetical protein EYC62_05225 [Alphaproteobacteria bacterium]